MALNGNYRRFKLRKWKIKQYFLIKTLQRGRSFRFQQTLKLYFFYFKLKLAEVVQDPNAIRSRFLCAAVILI